jgi:hypothetical protein
VWLARAQRLVPAVCVCVCVCVRVRASLRVCVSACVRACRAPRLPGCSSTQHKDGDPPPPTHTQKHTPTHAHTHARTRPASRQAPVRGRKPGSDRAITIPDQLVAVQAYVMWEDAGKPQVRTRPACVCVCGGGGGGGEGGQARAAALHCARTPAPAGGGWRPAALRGPVAPRCARVHVHAKHTRCR